KLRIANCKLQTGERPFVNLQFAICNRQFAISSLQCPLCSQIVTRSVGEGERAPACNVGMDCKLRIANCKLQTGERPFVNLQFAICNRQFAISSLQCPSCHQIVTRSVSEGERAP